MSDTPVKYLVHFIHTVLINPMLKFIKRVNAMKRLICLPAIFSCFFLSGQVIDKKDIRSIYESLESKNYELFETLLADDFEFHDLESEVFISGMRNTITYLEKVLNNQNHLRIKLKQLYFINDHKAMVRGKWKTSIGNKNVKLNFVSIIRFDHNGLMRSQSDDFDLHPLIPK